MRAVAVLVVTAAAAVLFAGVSDLAWPPVVLGLLCTLPALYVAWLAVPGVVNAPEAGAVRIPARARPAAQWDVRGLGVHAWISVAGVADEVPPEYVPRDVDDGEFGVRAQVEAAAQRGGFVLLVGGSSVGKTRSAAQAVTTLLRHWWLVRPDGPGQVAELAAPGRQMVVWLDELQLYLDGKDGLTAAAIGALVGPPHPAVVIGTLWTDFYNRYTTAAPAGGSPDPYAHERQLLDLATVIRIDPAFTRAEMVRARAAAARDPRLKAALESAGYGLTQTLAAAPQLVARWHDAQTADPYAWAVLTAALDAARLGARAPLSDGFLRAAAPGYLTSQQRAEASQDWFERAMDYATGKVRGVAAPLALAGAGMGQVAGYTAADYLIQHAARERRSALVPASTWEAAVEHVHDPADTARLARSAHIRLLYCYAIPLFRRACDTGDRDGAYLLAKLLAQRGDLDEAEQILSPLADAGYWGAAYELVGILAERGDLDGLRTMADAGERPADERLADLLARRGDMDELRGRADAGDELAAEQLALLLAERGDLDGAEQVLRPFLTHKRGAAVVLARILFLRGDLDGLRGRADAGDEFASARLAGLLAARGDLDGLRSRADAGDRAAASRLAALLAARGDLDGLRGRVEAGDWYATEQMAGRDGGVPVVAAGTDDDAGVWVRRLILEGQREEAERLRRFGLNADGSIACA
jgi:hypothetical protein